MSTNDALSKRAKRVVSENENLREVMSTLKTKITSGEGFVDKVESETDVVKQAETLPVLQVLGMSKT